jgi:hypothetical protein
VYIESYTENYQQTSHITFYFVEEAPGRGSEDIKQECNVNRFHFFFFSVFLRSWVEKSQST